MEVREGARPGDLAGELAGGAEELHLVRVGEGRGEGVAVGGGEAELLPERSGAAGEEPGVAGSVSGGIGEGVAGEAGARASRAGGRGDGDAADECVLAVGAELVTGAADDRAGGSVGSWGSSGQKLSFGGGGRTLAAHSMPPGPATAHQNGPLGESRERTPT